MSDKPKFHPNWSLLIPEILLLIEAIAFITMRQMGYKISRNIQYIFIAFGLFLIYRIAKHYILTWRVRKAIRQLKSVEKWIETNQPMAAIREWKKLLLNLPQEKYLQVLTLMEKVYAQENMPKATQAVKMVYAESIEFFEAVSGNNKEKLMDQQDWQNRVVNLRNMIRALPEEKDKPDLLHSK